MTEIILKKYTRKIDKEYTKLLMSDWKPKTNANWEISFDFNMENFQKAQDYLVKEMTDLSQEDIDGLTVWEFDNIIEKINKSKTPS